LENIIKDIEIKLEKFVEKHNKLISEHIILKEENKVISADLKAKNDELLVLQDKINLMKISKSVDNSKEEIKSTRLKINEYVREIDQCIALLNK